MSAYEKLDLLLHPQSSNEFILVSMIIFILITILQHLIFHTLWTWYHNGNEYFPKPGKWHKIRLINWWTGKTQPRRMLDYLKADGSNSAVKVLSTLDEFGMQKEWHMSIGAEKAKIIKTIFKRVTEGKSKSICIAEFGSYAGYSTVILGSQLRNEDCMYSVEIDEEFSDISSQTFRTAGLNNCQFICDNALSAIDTMRQIHDEPFDIVLLDHKKGEYLPTFLKLEKSGLIAKGTTVLANNAINPGLSDFLIYVRTAPEIFDSKLHHVNCSTKPHMDGIEEVTLL